MCGIVGCIGHENLVNFLIEGLEKLEYRGYDSSGIAFHNGEEVKIYKASGKLANLKKMLNGSLATTGNLKAGIGHIRWATHGAPNETNAHPHISLENKVAIVHNGIIENYKELKKELIENAVKIKRFELEALRTKQLIEEEILELPESLGINKTEISNIEDIIQRIQSAYRPELFTRGHVYT